ncbi:MAG TPA: Crp/Fnr family transcriptional regulator, partial [Oligoflexia bacterium]|nr:Crp/Fnr family transcriptional regulator [Oligoflexia bacterium]
MATPTVRRLKKGELLFNEGDPSKAMYFVQGGSIRLFKRKGTGSIELGSIHKGEVIGEMGFLDGGPRSASAEAVQDVELLEISNVNLAEQLKSMPPWLPVLLRTVVNRLRSANNKIRQLESASTAYTYGSEGVSTNYQFLSVYDVMKICTALLVVSSRGDGRCPMGRILRYANQIIGIHENKVAELLDVLERVGLVAIDKPAPDKIEVFVKD